LEKLLSAYFIDVETFPNTSSLSSLRPAAILGVGRVIDTIPECGSSVVSQSFPRQLQYYHSLPPDVIEQPFYAIINPAAGSGRAGRTWPRLRQELTALGLTVHDVLTQAPGQAIRLAEQLVTEGARELIVVGGDGTLNEVVNGIIDPQGRPRRRDLVITPVPCGTGRDFARLFGITRPEQLASLLLNGERCHVDVGVLDFRTPDGNLARRCFVNMADIGLGAETAAWVSTSTKRLGGFLSYLIGAGRTILRHRSHPLELSVDGVVVYRGPAMMVALANGRFHAGGMRLAPMASVSDGRLEVFVLRDVPRRELLFRLLPAVYRGRHIGHPAVQHWQGQVVTIHAHVPLRIEMDGEQPGTTDVTAGVLHRVLTVRVPHGKCQSDHAV